jgi:hypothetical protein
MQALRRFVNTLADHVIKYGVSAATPPPRAGGQVTLQEILLAQCPVLDKTEKTHLLVAANGLAHRLLNDALFREITGTRSM